MPEPRWIVSHTNATGTFDWVVSTTEPKEALGHFTSSLSTVGHDERKIVHHVRQFTIAMMAGRDGMTVLDPGLQGQITIRSIRTTATN